MAQKLMKVVMFEKLFRELQLDKANDDIEIRYISTKQGYDFSISSSIYKKSFKLSPWVKPGQVADNMLDGIRRFKVIYDKYKGNYPNDVFRNEEFINQLNKYLPEWFDGGCSTAGNTTVSVGK